jgi:hypothetical protein
MMAQLVGELEEGWGDRLGLYRKKMPRYLYYEAPLDVYTTWHERNSKSEPDEKQPSKPEPPPPAPTSQLELKKLIKVESDIERLQGMLTKLLEKDEAEPEAEAPKPKPVAFSGQTVSFSDRPNIARGSMSVVGGVPSGLLTGNLLSNRRSQSVVGLGTR